MRSDIPCPKKESTPQSAGITPKQVEELKRKKRSSSSVTDVEKWNEVYKILFPHDKHVPSPCMLQTS